MSGALRVEGPRRTESSELKDISSRHAVTHAEATVRVRKTLAKRTVTLPLLLLSAVTSVLYMPVWWISLVKPATSRALREKVILGVTSVNGCRWCSWLHSGFALKHGVNLDELQALLEPGAFGVLDDREGTAVLFAQHFAATLRRPTAAARRALASQFSPWQRLEIVAWIHFIYFCNLAGNSADAWLARFRGRPVADGHPLAEAIAGLIAAPVLLVAGASAAAGDPRR